MEYVKYKIANGDLNGAHNRWIQPPQVAYFVTTVDSSGNLNVTPTTMGTCIGHNFFSFTLSNHFIEEWDQDKYEFQDGVKQGYCNLREIKECVISYYGHSMLAESWAVAMPIPKGINEMDVIGLTPLQSEIVKPSGIAECPVNLEAKIISTHKLGKKWTHYICEVVHVTVHKELVEQNENGPLAGYGMMIIDPVFEVFIGKGGTPETDNVRLVYDRLDFDKIERCPEDIGCRDYWIGSFGQWMRDEESRGKLSHAEVERAIELETLWAANRDVVANAAVKDELIALLKKAVARV